MTAAEDILLILSTAGSPEIAETIASTLVEEQLAACVSVIPGLASTYLWKGAIEREKEVLLLIKTTRARFPELEERLLGIHPNEVPELLAFSADQVSETYGSWMAEVLSRRSRPPGSG